MPYPVTEDGQAAEVTAAFYAGLPKKRVAAGALLRDATGRLLLVRPTYREGWGIPGGLVEAGESPKDGCEREVLEEVGLAIDVGALLCVEWHAPEPPADEAVVFLFDGGTLDAGQIASITLQDSEIAESRFATPDDAATLLRPARLSRRVQAGLGALGEGAIYLQT